MSSTNAHSDVPPTPPVDAAATGERVRRLRIQAGQGVRELAREIGISASSLSALENSRGGTSLRRLQQVAEHFGLHVTDLLAEAPTVEHVLDAGPEIIRGLSSGVPGVQRGDGVLYQLVGRSGPHHQLQPYLISFEPSGTYEKDPIAHPGEEFAYVLFGEVELLLGADVHRLAQGDAARFNPDVPHSFRNASTTGMALLIGCATPPW